MSEKTLVITIPLSSNDLEETDFEVFKAESEPDGATIGLCVGRPLSEEESHIVRYFEIGAENYRIEVLDAEPVKVDQSADEFLATHPLGNELEQLIAQYIPVHKCGRSRFLQALLQRYDLKRKEIPQR